MSRSIVARAKEVSPELAAWMERVAERALVFDGASALADSAANHEHLWAVEWWADRDRRVDPAFRRDAVRLLDDRWRARLPGYAPWQRGGYWIYVYSDLAPTVTVVEHGQGAPMFDESSRVVDRLEDVLDPYQGASWGDLWRGGPDPSAALLKTIERHEGSIGAPVASSLGIGRGELRRWIEALDLRDQVNTLRKRFRRRPARFRTDLELAEVAVRATRVWAQRVARHSG